MDKEGVLAALAILVLSGVLVYGFRHAQSTQATSARTVSAEPIKGAENDLAVGDALAFNYGSDIYVANTPYLFQAPLGNIIPAASVSNIPYSAGGIAIS